MPGCLVYAECFNSLHGGSAECLDLVCRPARWLIVAQLDEIGWAASVFVSDRDNACNALVSQGFNGELWAVHQLSYN